MHGYDQGMSHHLEHEDGTELRDPEGHQHFAEDVQHIDDMAEQDGEMVHHAGGYSHDMDEHHGEDGAVHHADDMAAREEHPGVDPDSDLIDPEDEHEEIHVSDAHIEHEHDPDHEAAHEHES